MKKVRFVDTRKTKKMSTREDEGSPTRFRSQNTDFFRKTENCETKLLMSIIRKNTRKKKKVLKFPEAARIYRTNE